MKRLFILGLILAILLIPLANGHSLASPSFTCVEVIEIPVTECEALVVLYASTDGGNWTNNTNWLVTNTPSDWYGITVEEGHVTELFLVSNQLSGNLPVQLENLSALKVLYLMWNQLTGPIPPELGNLTELTELGLTGNQLTGNIPVELTDLSYLGNLFLQDNLLTGAIPPEIGSMWRLFQLGLSGNQLTGSIPPELGNLINLSVLQLGDNQLTGSIPPELGKMKARLFGLYLYGNQLTDTIPVELGDLTNLHRIDLSNNQLEGDVPSTFTQLVNLYDAGEAWGGADGLNLDYNKLNVPLDYPTSELDIFISQKDPDWQTLQAFDQVIGSSGGVLISLDERTDISVLSGTLEGDTTFTFVPLPEPSYETGVLSFANLGFQLTAEDELGTLITAFNPPLTVTISYRDEDIGSIPENSLALYYWDTSGSTWVDAVTTCPGGVYTRDPDGNTFSLPICHLSEFTVLGDPPLRTFLPMVQVTR